MNIYSIINRFAGFIGNFLEHYDNALFGLSAPFIAPLFFEQTDPITALIWTYGMLPLGLLTRPLGALFFGWIGDSWGRKHALFLSLLGMAVVTTGMGFLPTYRQIGILAPLLLAISRMLQNFFCAGESAGGAIFVLEQTTASKRGFVGSCYDASSIGGILFASCLVTWMSSQGQLEENWRVLFWIGGMTAFFGILIRWLAKNETEFEKTDKSEGGILAIRKCFSPLVSIIFASGFSHITYSLAFTFMNGYVPLVTTLTHAEAMQANTLLLIVDFALLPIFGFLSAKWGKERIMLLGAFGASLGAIPLFALLDRASLEMVIFVRLAILVCGVAFSAPYYAWALEQVPIRQRYLILSFGGAIGSQMIGSPTAAVSLWLYQSLNWSIAPGFYLLVFALFAAWIIQSSIVPSKEVTY